MAKRFSVLLAIPLFLLFQCTAPNKDPYPIIQNELIDSASQAMIVSAHPLATRSGLSILREGGNAIDAIIATQFSLAVVYPRAGNIGGGGFLISRDPKGVANALDFREKAPQSAFEKMYRDSMNDVLPYLSLTGPTASGVPGTVAGLYSAFERFSKLNNWELLLTPAIQIAERGFAISANEAKRLNQYQEEFRKWNQASFCPMIKNKKWKEGDILVQHRLAETLKKIQKNGPDGFYSGPIAQQLHNFMDSSDGYITTSDLKAYKAVWRAPIEVDYLNYRMISMPPPSSGGIALGQLLKYAEHALPNHPIHHPESAHVLIEAERRVYADRAHYLGDEDFVDIPDFLLDTQYLHENWSDFSATTAGISSTLPSDSNIIRKESFETTHTSVVDPSGWAASLTTTLNSNYGSKVMLPEGGFFLNNEMDDFSAKPGVPNQFGLIGSQANAIAPEKRMLSSMTPTIFERDGQLYLIIGSPGGSTIITSVFQVFLHLTHDNATLKEALTKARFHHQWLPDKVLIEQNNWESDLGAQLQAMGHKLDTVNTMGLVKAILCDNQIYIGGGDPRSGDHAEGLND